MTAGQKAKRVVEERNRSLKDILRIEVPEKIDQYLADANLSAEDKVAVKEMIEDVSMSLPPPVFKTIIHQRISYAWKTGEQRYARYREMVATDPELYGVINDFASLVRHAFNAVIIRPGHEMSETEELVLEKAKEFADSFEIEEYFYAAAFNIVKDGDVIIAIDMSEDPWRLVCLPMEYVTALDDMKQYGDPGYAISKPIAYILDEQELLQYGKEEIKIDRRTYPIERIIHIPWNNKGTIIKDNLGRICYNVWSQSPIHPLQKTFEWKQHATDVDIIWRARMPPRVHHKLNLEAYAPENFKGSRQQQLAASRTAGQAVMDEYSENAEYKEADQDYITGQEVDIGIIESKSTNYHAPNELFEYFIMVFCAIVGVPKAAFQGESGGSFAADLIISNYASMRAEIIAVKIAKKFTKVIRDYLTHLYEKDPKAFPKKHIKKVEVQVSLMFNNDFRELGRFLSLMAGTGAFTQDELREYLGKLPLTKEEIKRITFIGPGGTQFPGYEPPPVPTGGTGGRPDGSRTGADAAAQAQRGGADDYPETPASQSKGQDT